MGRKRLGEEADRQRITALLKEDNPGWKQTRLAALKMGFMGKTPVDFIAESLGVSQSVPRYFQWVIIRSKIELECIFSLSSPQKPVFMGFEKENMHLAKPNHMNTESFFHRK